VIRSLRIGVTKGLIQVGNLDKRGPLATAVGPPANIRKELDKWLWTGCGLLCKTLNQRKILRKTQKNNLLET